MCRCCEPIQVSGHHYGHPGGCHPPAFGHWGFPFHVPSTEEEMENLKKYKQKLEKELENIQERIKELE